MELAPGSITSARKRKKKDRTVVAFDSAILRGTLYRASDIVPDCVKLREAVLFEDKIGTFGRNFTNGKTERRKKVLDKIWVFAPHHKLESVKRRKFSTLENERKHSVLNYLTSDHYVEQELYTFSIQSEVARKKDGAVLVLEKICLAFYDLAEAMKWRQAIAQQIASLRRRQQPTLPLGASTRNLAASENGNGNGESPSPEEVVVRVDTGESARPSALDTAMTNDIGSQQSVSDMRTPPGTPMSQSILDDDDVFSAAEVQERSTSLASLQADLVTDARLPKMGAWKVISCENNITVLRGTESHNASSIMLSYVIRAPPRLCVKSLLKQNRKSEVDHFYLDIEVVEQVDPFNDVLLTIWKPSGLQRFFMAPRKLRMRRLWRREDDGSYVALYKALDEEESNARHWFFDWFAPISCKLVNTCLTFSPLRTEYSNNGESSETLVTQVSCYGDLGGWLGLSHPFRRVLNFLAPFSMAASWAFIRLHVQCGVAIRNQAEAARFCVRPYLQSHEEVELLADLPPLSVKSRLFQAAQSRQPRYTDLTLSASSPLRPPASLFADTTLRPVSEEGSKVAEFGNAQGSQYVTAPHSVEDDLSPIDVATCDPKYWTCPGANGLKVRGANYLVDKKKIPAGEPIFSLVATDLLQVDKPTFNIARFLPSLRHSKSSFTFIMQIMFGHPSLSLTFSWAAPTRGEAHASFQSLSSNKSAGSLTSHLSASSPVPSEFGETPFDEGDLLNKPFELTLARFLAGGTNDKEANKRRDGTLKLIPRISQGAWFVKQAVGTTPCLLGRKLTATYHRGPGYFEVDVDVTSSSVAANIVGLVQGTTKSLCVDMAICLEGHTPEELPESLLGTVRCSHLDLNSAKLLDTSSGAITDKPGAPADIRSQWTATVMQQKKTLIGKKTL